MFVLTLLLRRSLALALVLTIHMQGRSLFWALLVLLSFSTVGSPHLELKWEFYHVYINPVGLARVKFARGLIGQHASFN